MQKWVIINTAALALLGPAAFGQDGQPEREGVTPPATTPTPESAASIDQADAPWTINVEPGAWFVGAGGRLKMPRSTPGPNAKTEISNLNLDNPRFVPFAEVNARKGRLRFALRGFVYDADKDSSGNFGQIGDLTFGPTDTIRSSMHFASYEIEGAYTLAGRPLNKGEDGYYAIDTKFDAVGGLRIYDVDWTIRNTTAGATPPTTTANGVFVQPEIGVKLSMDFGRDFTIDLQATFGGLPTGSNTSYAADIIAGFIYRPTPHVGVQIGYRSLFFGVGKGDGEGEFSFNGAVQGLYGGLVFRF